jgi:protein O-mannosyl-transferase
MWRDIVICAVLAFFTLVVFSPVKNYVFTQYDDRDDVWRNPNINSGLTWNNFEWAFTTGERANWIPLTRLSNQLDYTLWPQDPNNPDAYKGKHHMVNVLMHTLNALLLYLVLVRMTGSRWACGFVAGLFALHPLHVESVAWIVERKDVLSTMFWLLTMGAYVLYVQQRDGRRWVFYGLTILGLALGLAAKPMLVTLPFVLLLMDYWPLRRLGWPTAAEDGELLETEDGVASIRTPIWVVLLEKLPLLLLAVASCVVTYEVQRAGGAMTYSEKLQSYSHWAYVPVAYVVYLGQTFWPSGLACFYPFHEDFPRWWTWASSAVLLVITGLVVWQIRRRPYLAVGWFWYLGTLVPVIGLVKVGLHSVADRYTYVPLAGIFVMVAWGAADLLSRWKMRWVILGTAAAAVLITCMALTSKQLPYWENTYTLFERDIEVAGPNSVAYYNMGDESILAGHLQDSIEYYKQALKQDPTLAGVHNNIGWASSRIARDKAMQALQAKSEEAEKLLRESRQMSEIAEFHYHESIRLEPENASSHNNLGLFYFESGKFDEAFKEFNLAIKLQPNFAAAHNNLGLAYMRQNQLEEAVREFRATIALDPSLAMAHKNLGQILIGWGEFREGRDSLQKALQLNPGWPEIVLRLTRLEATCPDEAYRNGQAAVEKAQAIRAQSPPAMLILDTLAAAYAETRRFDQAITVEQEALDLAVKSNQPGDVLLVQDHLRLLQAGLPIRDPIILRTPAPTSTQGPVSP